MMKKKDHLPESRIDELMDKMINYFENFKQSQIGIFRLDPTLTKVQITNEQTAELFGYSLEEFKIIPFLNHFFSQEMFSRLSRNLHKKDYIENFRLRFKKKDGSIIWCTLSANLSTQNNSVDFLITDISERVRTRSRYKIENIKLKKLLELSDSLFVSLNSTDKILTTNNKVLKILSYNTKDILGKKWNTFFDSTKSIEINNLLDNIEGNEILNFESNFSNSKGELFTILWSFHRVKEKQTNHQEIVCFGIDISATKIVEAESKRLAMVVEKATNAIAIANLDGYITYVNKSWADIHGYNKNELIGKHLNIFHTEEQLVQYVTPFNEKLKANGKHQGEVGHKRKDGTIFYTWMTNIILTDSNNKPSVLVAIAIDITKNKEDEKALQESEEKYRSLINQLVEGVVICQGMPPVIVLVNPAMSKLMGISIEEFQSFDFESMKTIVYHEDRKTFFDNYFSRLMGKDTPDYYEVRGVRKDGSLIWFGVSGRQILYGNEPSILATFSDISEQKKIQQDLSDLNIELEKRVVERTQQLQLINKELEAFSYSVSHDLQTPLRHIMGFAEISNNYLDKNDIENAKKFAQKIIDSGEQMQQLINDLLSFSQVARKDIIKRRINLENLLETTIVDLDLMIGERKIKWHYQNLIDIYGDIGLIKLVLNNLLLNSIKFTREKSKAIIEIGSYETESETVVFVKDNGIGFDMSFHDVLFEPFTRLHTTGNFEGSGIGLANVKRIIHRHNGSVWAEGEEGKGSIFFFSLPKENI